MLYSQPHLTSSIIMVHPVDFGYNDQTGQDNEFQHRPQQSESAVKTAAKEEFAAMLENLLKHDIEVLELHKSHTQQRLPDAVFPNNWFSTRQDGSLFIYPMKTPNRQAEVQLEPLQQSLLDSGYQIKRIVDLRSTIEPELALEGTGSLIFHHPSGSLFAAVSERCDREALVDFAQQYDYNLYPFTTNSSRGMPIYHTNVLMSCGEKFAVMTKGILLESSESKASLDHLRSLVDDFIEIDEAQMQEYFCGNIIQLQNRQQQPCIVLSSSAYDGFNTKQRSALERHGELIICSIPTIEHVGGGSARCMIAENFLPRS